MKIYNASQALPTPALDLSALPPVLCTDRDFWQKSYDPDGGVASIPEGAMPEIDSGKLRALAQKAKAQYNSTFIFDLESPYFAQSIQKPDLFIDRVAQAQRMIDIVRSEGVKYVSINGLPFGQNPEHELDSTLSQWEANSLALKPLIDQFTMLCPWAYSSDMPQMTYARMMAYVISICQKHWPDKEVWPLVCARAEFEGTAGRYELKPTFYGRLATLRSFSCVTRVCYWDANFNTTFRTLAEVPVYNMLKLVNQYPDLTDPPTDAGRPSGSAFFA